MATQPPNFDPNAPFDPTNADDPRYDPRRDPRYDPRWQKAQQRYYAGQQRAATRAQAAAYKAQARAQRDQWRMYWRGQRRPSLVGPLLLVSIGIVFLLIHTGRLPAFSFFEWFGRFWPVLLIGVGVLRLAEWAIDRARQPAGAPPVRYSVGGGVTVLIVVLALIGILVQHGAHWHADRQHGFGFFAPGDWNDGGFFGQRHEQNDAPVTHAIAAAGSLSIENPHGDVTVTGTSDDGQVHLNTRKEVFTSADDTANDRLHDLTPEFEGVDNALTLRVPHVESGSTELTLLVPPTVHILLNSDHGDVRVTNMKAPLSVTSNNGDVEIAAITGAVQLHANHRRRDLNVRSVTGDVAVDGNGSEVTLSDIRGNVTVHGDFASGGHLQHISGAVEYHSSRTDLSLTHLNGDLQLDGNDLSASEAAGPMLVSTRSRNINLDKVTGDIKVVNNHGDVDVHVALPTGTLTVDNQNGNVNVSLPEKARFTLSAETSDGDAHSDFSGTDTHSGRGMLSGAINGGGPSVRINTSHGDINVSQNSNGVLPPVPPAPALSSYGAIPGPPLPPESSGAIAEAQHRPYDAKEQVARTKEQVRRHLREAQKGSSGDNE